MDPEVVLTKLREAAATWLRLTDAEFLSAGQEQEREQSGTDMAEHVEALDGWLCCKGFLPHDWARKGGK